MAGNRRSGKKSTKKAAQDLLQDDRFTALFSDPRYQVDMDDPEYKALHPNQSPHNAALLNEHYKSIDDEDNDDEDSDDREVDGDEENELERDWSLRGPEYESGRDEHALRAQGKMKREVKMYSAKDASHAKAYAKNESTVRPFLMQSMQVASMRIT